VPSLARLLNVGSPPCPNPGRRQPCPPSKEARSASTFGDLIPCPPLLLNDRARPCSSPLRRESSCADKFVVVIKRISSRASLKIYSCSRAIDSEVTYNTYKHEAIEFKQAPEFLEIEGDLRLRVHGESIQAVPSKPGVSRFLSTCFTRSARWRFWTRKES
jgi:hypothetical protein